jgi:hypothetical protein
MKEYGKSSKGTVHFPYMLPDYAQTVVVMIGGKVDRLKDVTKRKT